MRSPTEGKVAHLGLFASHFAVKTTRQLHVLHNVHVDHPCTRKSELNLSWTFYRSYPRTLYPKKLQVHIT
jgi:hypothetical protein